MAPVGGGSCAAGHVVPGVGESAPRARRGSFSEGDKVDESQQKWNYAGLLKKTSAG